MRRIIRGLTTCAGLLLYAGLMVSCKKEYSYEGGIAVFSLFNSGGSCLGETLAGGYIIGTALGKSNSVQLQVDVTTIGVYTLQTDIRSGIQFSTSGKFTDTGIQTITLSGTGTPDSVGNFPFIPGTFQNCPFIVPISQTAAKTADFTLEGAPNQCSNAQVLGNYYPGMALAGTNKVVLNVNVISPGAYSINTDTQNGISFSASGTFTKAGVQTIVLAGSGTPLIANNLLLTPNGNGSGCTFSLAVVSPGPPATYVIQSGSNLCIGSATGIYSTGTPLNSLNTYTLQVYVSYLGNFAISTATVNGVTFSFSGTFTTLGIQNVTLTGSGTPTIAGTFTFTPQIVGPSPLGGHACSFSLTVN
jgi:hypothetical protein